MNEVNVLPLIETADVVGFTNAAIMKDGVYCTGMIFYEQPVTHILTFTINRYRLVGFDIVDGQRDQFFREVMRAIVIGTVTQYNRDLVSVVICFYKMVGAGLGG
jgi:hypothetical protein